MSMTDDVILGISQQWGHERPFQLSRADRRYHVYVIGKTGVGKSTLLENMIVQDIENGLGVAFIDPHGTSALRILDRIPKHRFSEVVYFDPSDEEHPVSFNLFAQVPPNRRHLVASGVVSAFKGIFPEFFGPRMEYIFHAAVTALLDCDNVSLLSLPRMLTDDRYRRWVVKQVKDPVVRSFWEYEFESHDKKTKAEMVSPILNKIGPILMAPQVRNILGQVRNRIDARYVMDHGRIFIANLSKGLLGESKANLLGSFLVSQFQFAAMARADVEEDQRPDFMLFVDEFQSFVTDSFATMLSEIRKYRVCLTLSHQYLAQIKTEILDAVIGNVGSMIAFRVGYTDAEALEKAFGKTYTAGSFATLSNREVYAKVLCDGKEGEPFAGAMLPPLAGAMLPPSGDQQDPGRRYRKNYVSRRQRIIDRSRQTYAASRELVEKRINAWFGAPAW